MAAAAATARRIASAAALPERQIELGYRLSLDAAPPRGKEALAEEFLRDSRRRLGAVRPALTEVHGLVNLTSFV